MVTLHEGRSFLVSDDLGDIRPGTEGGYYDLDTRFLSLHELRLEGQKPVLLDVDAPQSHEARHFLTNPELDGAKRSTLGIVLHRVVGGGLREQLEIENFGEEEAHLQLAIGFEADFAYILTVKKEANTGETSWHPSVETEQGPDRKSIALRLVGADIPHETRLSFSEEPEELSSGLARFRISLPRRGRWCLVTALEVSLGGKGSAAARGGAAGADARAARSLQRTSEIAQECASLECDLGILRQAFDRASLDLSELRIKGEALGAEDEGLCAIAAGIPWYMDLFGRDSLVASFESTLHDPRLARGTLSALARLQGKKRDPVTEEAPGKILHEYRPGPLTPAARKLIPAYPYYGTIDATPLFLITLSEYVRCTGDLELAREMRPHVEAALRWMQEWGDRDGDGLLEYQRDSDVGLENQGWKDSRDSMRFRDGRIAKPPIAPVEVQGYAYDARLRTAEILRHLGDAAQADRLTAEAVALRKKIVSSYRIDDRGFFAEALDGSKSPVDSLTSNPGHLLWCGVLDRGDAREVAKVLLSDEMFSGFGVRTMGSGEGGYNPISYHDGSVWPHDNALILKGLVRYGLRDEALRLASGFIEALRHFEKHRPPELFCGYPADRFGVPVDYPTANRPQAWASGAVLLLVRALLGLEVDALRRRVALDPLPLPGMTRLALHRVPVGGERVDFEVRVEDGKARAEVGRLPAGWQREEARPEGA